MDAQIKTQAEGFIADFVSAAQAYRAPSEADKSSFSVDYQLFSLTGEDGTPRCISILFLLNTKVPGTAQDSESIRTLLFDTQSAQLLQANDIFLENQQEALSRKIRDYFQNNPEYWDETNSAQFLDKTSAARGDFSRLSITSSSITFYFDRSELFADGPAPQAVFTPKEMQDILRPEFCAVPPDLGASEESTDPEKNTVPSVTDPAAETTEAPKGKAVALTFDDGPSLTITPRVLKLLAENDAKATFFLIGMQLPGREDVVRQAIAQGCEIGNHTYEHKYLTRISKAECHRQISKCNEMLREITDESCKFFRPPGGYYKGIEKEIKMPIFLWSIDTNDWRVHKLAEKPKKDKERAAAVQKIVDTVLEQVQDGDIILMHDIYELTADACEQIIPGLAERGFRMLTLSELFAEKGIKLEKSTVYRNARPIPPDEATTGIVQPDSSTQAHSSSAGKAASP